MPLCGFVFSALDYTGDAYINVTDVEYLSQVVFNNTGLEQYGE